MKQKSLDDSLIKSAATNKSHFKEFHDLEDKLKYYSNRIVSRGDLPHTTVQNQLEILKELSEFPLGRHIIETGGANGFWTDYMICYDEHRNNKRKLSDLEDFLINRSLHVNAQRELYFLFQETAQSKLKDQMVLASIPCGMMRDLIELDFSNVKNTRLLGIDIDPHALSCADQLRTKAGLNNVTLKQKDAWNLGISSQIDVINSIGLNVYEPDKDKVQALYLNFYTALKPNGILFTGVLTHPPGSDEKSDWMIDNINQNDLFLEMVLFRDILNLKWMNFRSLSNIKEDFFKAGFKKVEVISDENQIFPAIIAHK